MARYIDADIAHEMLLRGYVISDVPTADVQEVRHGKWISEIVKKPEWRGKEQCF